MQVQQMGLQGQPMFPGLFPHGEFMGNLYTHISPPWQNSDTIRAKIDSPKPVTLTFFINIKLQKFQHFANVPSWWVPHTQGDKSPPVGGEPGGFSAPCHLQTLELSGQSHMAHWSPGL